MRVVGWTLAGVGIEVGAPHDGLPLASIPASG
ncbi:Uncharacterised protein [Burkholderia pseudomallei]|nr:Uncharacterised protein [Burkholderia pseudomallei]